MKNVIHYVLILDKSGSMRDIKSLAISSFNEQIDRIRKIKAANPDVEVRITLTTFNDEIRQNAFCQDIDHLKKLSAVTYQPDSMTALYDAVGITYRKMSDVVLAHEKVVFAVFTDGLENASKEFTAEDVSRIIEESDKKGWDFSFYCRYEDKLHYRTQLNIPDENLVSMSLNEEGFNLMANELDIRFKRMFRR